MGDFMTVCERMFQIMDSKGLKPADLCKIIGVSTAQTTSWKKRNTDPPVKYLTKICSFLNVSLEYLITGNEKMNTDNERQMLELFSQLNKSQQDQEIGRLSVLEEQNNEKARSEKRTG